MERKEGSRKQPNQGDKVVLCKLLTHWIPRVKKLSVGERSREEKGETILRYGHFRIEG
jgi:hypothetical protein